MSDFFYSGFDAGSPYYQGQFGGTMFSPYDYYNPGMNPYYGYWPGTIYDPSLGGSDFIGIGGGSGGGISLPGGGINIEIPPIVIGGGGGNGTPSTGNQANDPSTKLPWWVPIVLAGSGLAASALGGRGSQIQPQTAPDKFPELKTAVNDMLKAQYDPTTGQMKELPGYGGQIANPMSQMQQAVANNWQPWDAGTQYLAQYLASPSRGNSQALGQMANSAMAYGSPSNMTNQLMNNQVQYGGAGDWTTQNLHNLAQFGTSTPTSPGASGVLNAIQYGGPSSVANYMGNMAQFGVTGQAGMPMYQRAMGQVNPALSQFMNANPYRAPSIPTWGRR